MIKQSYLLSATVKYANMNTNYYRVDLSPSTDDPVAILRYNYARMFRLTNLFL